MNWVYLMRYELKKTLNEIISTAFYKQDYNRNTKTFLAEDVAYEEAIDSLKKLSTATFYQLSSKYKRPTS